MANRKLRIVKVLDGARPNGLGHFPWNSYWDVREGGRSLATVSTCNDFDKGLYVEGGHLTPEERATVCAALKVSN